MKILIVDDDPTIRRLVTVILSKEGHDVRTVARGVDAIVYLQSEEDVDLVITDLNMPGIRGIELVEVVRALQGRRANVPAFLLLTAIDPKRIHDPENADVAQAIEAGFDAILPKSFDRAGLVRAVNSLKTRARRLMSRKQLAVIREGSPASSPS